MNPENHLLSYAAYCVSKMTVLQLAISLLLLLLLMTLIKRKFEKEINKCANTHQPVLTIFCRQKLVLLSTVYIYYFSPSHFCVTPVDNMVNVISGAGSASPATAGTTDPVICRFCSNL